MDFGCEHCIKLSAEEKKVIQVESHLVYFALATDCLMSGTNELNHHSSCRNVTSFSLKNVDLMQTSIEPTAKI